MGKRPEAENVALVIRIHIHEGSSILGGKPGSAGGLKQGKSVRVFEALDVRRSVGVQCVKVLSMFPKVT